MLEHKASRDSLTGAFNRAFVTEALDAQLKLAERTGLPLSILLGDIDHFKAINDSLGHPAGDEVLCEIVRRFKTTTRQGDCFGRYGGEEFLFVLYPCGAENALGAAERLRAARHGTSVSTRHRRSGRPAGHAQHRRDQHRGRRRCKRPRLDQTRRRGVVSREGRRAQSRRAGPAEYLVTAGAVTLRATASAGSGLSMSHRRGRSAPRQRLSPGHRSQNERIRCDIERPDPGRVRLPATASGPRFRSHTR
jgi:diguanylate cyclase (GGDEF)-like protein